MGRSGFALALLFVVAKNVSHAARPEWRDLVKAARHTLNIDEVTQDAPAWSHINNKKVIAADLAAQSGELSGRLTTFNNSLVDETVALVGEIEGGFRRTEDKRVAKVNVSEQAELSPCTGNTGFGCADDHICCGDGCIPRGRTCCKGTGNAFFSCSPGNICSGNHCAVVLREADLTLPLPIAPKEVCNDLLTKDSLFWDAFIKARYPSSTHSNLYQTRRCLGECEAACPIIRDMLEFESGQQSMLCSHQNDLDCFYGDDGNRPDGLPGRRDGLKYDSRLARGSPIGLPQRKMFFHRKRCSPNHTA